MVITPVIPAATPVMKTGKGMAVVRAMAVIIRPVPIALCSGCQRGYLASAGLREQVNAANELRRTDRRVISCVDVSHAVLLIAAVGVGGWVGGGVVWWGRGARPRV